MTLKGETTTSALMHWCTTASKSDLSKLLEGTPAQGLFDADAAKALASTRFILTSFLAAHKYMKPGDFSLPRWLEEGSGNLYLTWREDMQSALMPLVGCWVDVLANAVLSLPADSTRHVWLVLDELGGLGRLNSLEASLTRGRKHGLCVIAGLQSTAQLDLAYGREGAVVLRSCFRNLVVLGIAKSDHPADHAARQCSAKYSPPLARGGHNNTRAHRAVCAARFVGVLVVGGVALLVVATAALAVARETSQRRVWYLMIRLSRPSLTTACSSGGNWSMASNCKRKSSDGSRSVFSKTNTSALTDSASASRRTTSRMG